MKRKKNTNKIFIHFIAVAVVANSTKLFFIPMTHQRLVMSFCSFLLLNGEIQDGKDCWLNENYRKEKTENYSLLLEIRFRSIGWFMELTEDVILREKKKSAQQKKKHRHQFFLSHQNRRTKRDIKFTTMPMPFIQLKKEDKYFSFAKKKLNQWFLYFFDVFACFYSISFLSFIFSHKMTTRCT